MAKTVLFELEPIAQLRVSLCVAVGALAGWILGANDAFEYVDDVQEWTVRRSGGLTDMFAILFT